jgi:hypothetical protein
MPDEPRRWAVGVALCISACATAAPDGGPPPGWEVEAAPHPVALGLAAGPPMPAPPLRSGPLAFRLGDEDAGLPAGPPPPPSDDWEMPALWGEVEDAWFDEDRGAALEAHLEGYPAGEVAANGVALLTLDELFGTAAQDYEDALCESPAVVWEFEEDGEAWEATALTFSYSLLYETPEPATVEISDTCADTLDGGLDPAAAVAAGACVTDEELSFFREGTACRSCLDEGTPWSACVDAGSCAEAAPWAWTWTDASGATEVVQTGVSYTMACAPDWVLRVFVVWRANEAGAVPGPFDTDAWVGMCVPFTLETGELYTGCAGESALQTGEEQTLGAGAPLRIASIRRSGEDTLGWWERTAYARSVHLDIGRTFRTFWASGSGGLGPVSAPLDRGGWGLPPRELRPDGDDADDPFDTFAVDWVAAATLKASTRRGGVLVTAENHSRCLEGAWVGPDDAGQHRCTEMGAQSGVGWLEDGITLSAGGELAYAMPLRTLGTTGLPDPEVPGGVVVHVASSDSYERLEGWSYPHHFTPDLVPYDDAVDDPTWAGAGALVGEGYRFGKEAEWELRMVMGSSWPRQHRALDGDGAAP